MALASHSPCSRNHVLKRIRNSAATENSVQAVFRSPISLGIDARRLACVDALARWEGLGFAATGNGFSCRPLPPAQSLSTLSVLHGASLAPVLTLNHPVQSGSEWGLYSPAVSGIFLSHCLRHHSRAVPRTAASIQKNHCPVTVSVHHTS